MARFTRQGRAKYFFLPTCAGYAAADPQTSVKPTAAELTAGVELTQSIAGVTGWQQSSAQVATPDMASRFNSNIPGTKSVGDSGFTHYADDTADLIRDALPDDATGFVWIIKGTTKGDLFPVRVASTGDEHAIGDEPARWASSFSTTAQPATEIAA